ncbi:MAG: hypothetical protein FWE06_06340 [Oscillospiraceae bacterium]|nr:hypothetical protein [Oscillospiraceae bacterium]
MSHIIEKCEKCGSDNLRQGELTGYGGSLFNPDGKRSIFGMLKVTAIACKNCGNVFNLALENPHKLK